MGQYKVPQNVEAEDKIIGALTIKQFIYTVIGVAWALLSFSLLRKLPLIMVLVGLPPTTLFLLLGLYQRQDQPFEALFLSLTSFLAKPRKRLWQKEPITEVFKVEPPKIVKERTQRDPQEIYGQLEHLSQIVDTRGWGSKTEALQEPGQSQTLEAGDRLVMPELPATAAPLATDVSVADDILDFQNNPGAQNLNVLIQDASKSIRDEAVAKLADQRPVAAVKATATTTTPVAQPENASASEMTSNPLNGILKLAMENNDVSVSRLAQQANRQPANLSEGQAVSLRDATKNP